FGAGPSIAHARPPEPGLRRRPSRTASSPALDVSPLSNPARLFSPTSLRFRLVLAFLALVILVLFVGLASYSLNQDVRTQVSDLRPSSRIDLRRIDLSNVGLEFEGHWNPSGSFVATGIEVVPGIERPRLRGAIQRIDAAARTFTLYGIALHVTDSTESGDDV